MHRIGLGLVVGAVWALASMAPVFAQTAPPQDGAPAAQEGVPAIKDLPPAKDLPETKDGPDIKDLPQEPSDTLTQAPPQFAGRYSFDRVNGAILRMDSVSGRLTICGQSAAGWVCHTVPEDRAALEKEIGRLQAQIADQKKQIAALREPPPPPRPPEDLVPPAQGEPEATIKMPSHEDMERARAAIENAWRRLVDMINDFQRDMMKKD